MSEPRYCRLCMVVIPLTRATQAKYCSHHCHRLACKRKYNQKHKVYFREYRKKYLQDPDNKERKLVLQRERRKAARAKYPGGSKRAAAIQLGFRSWFEVELRDQLKKSKVQFGYETEKIPYTLICQYVPDFVLIKQSGDKMLIECKGHFDAPSRRKMAAVKLQHPNLDIRIVFYNASGKIRKGSNTTNADWAKKNGFKWADGSIPKKWMKE